MKKINKKDLTIINNEMFDMNFRSPTYLSSFFNIVNKDAHSSRPETVGNLSTDIFPKYIEKAENPTPKGWEEYYKSQNPDKYNNGLDKFKRKFEQEKQAINAATEKDLVDWYNDLMFSKTFAGLYVENAILKDIANGKGQNEYKKSSKDDEGKGIDGYIENVPYSIKPETYKETATKQIENIKAKMVYYRYTKDANGKIDGVEYYIEEDEK